MFLIQYFCISSRFPHYFLRKDLSELPSLPLLIVSASIGRWDREGYPRPWENTGSWESAWEFLGEVSGDTWLKQEREKWDRRLGSRKDANLQCLHSSVANWRDFRFSEQENAIIRPGLCHFNLSCGLDNVLGEGREDEKGTRPSRRWTL